MFRRLPGLIVAACVALVGAGAARGEDSHVSSSTEPLYRSVVVVTGQRVENRPAGFAQALRDVLIKVTGDPRIIKERKFSALAGKADSFVQTFSYRDVLEGKPIHDEQGTYDRPHYLTVVFDPGKIDTLARSLGREPWRAPRPRVVAFVAVENMRASFMLASDSVVDRSEDMRAALAAAANKAGISASLPNLSQLEAHGWTYKTLGTAPFTELVALARESGGDMALAGRIVFREQALGWIARWRLEHRGKVYQWGVRGISFDDAFRNALYGSMQIVSGHGQPDENMVP